MKVSFEDDSEFSVCFNIITSYFSLVSLVMNLGGPWYLENMPCHFDDKWAALIDGKLFTRNIIMMS